MANIIRIDPVTFELQTYDAQDENLISKLQLDTGLKAQDFIEFYIYDLNNNILFSDLNYTDYLTSRTDKGTTVPSIVELDPENDVTSQGFNQGKYIAYYNFLDPVIGIQEDLLFISEISSDRTEIRLISNELTNDEIVKSTNQFIEFRESQQYFVDFYLNFSNNDLIIANNVKLENAETKNPSILIKLYDPLPQNFDLKSELFVVTKLNNPQAFQVDYPVETSTSDDFLSLKGPNFNLSLKGQVNNSSQNFSYNDLISGAPTSSQDQINSLLEESSIPISVDYTDFNEFIHFSSAQTRIENFYYKVGLIENYSASIASVTDVTSSNTTAEIQKKKISNVIKNFDKFEYFMYYDSGSSFSYPKTTSTPPYLLAKTTSSQALTWLGSANESNAYFGGRLDAAFNYDNANSNELKKSIPEYLREDPNNLQYDLFIDMIAQYYDNIWLYTKAITEKYNADNRLDFGISKDLVADAIKDFGLKLYQNNFSNKELYSAFLGITPAGSVFADPTITGSFPAPMGLEYIDTLISASNDVTPLEDVNKSLYKRIYHNIPYLLKSKGTIAGLRALITSYGIPDTILKISEFGGKDKVNENDWDYYFNNYNYALGVGPNSNFISSSWDINSAWGSYNNQPETVEFRFKAEKFPPTNLTQSLFSIKKGTTGFESLLELEYSGSGLTSGSYTGSIKDPYYQYATLKWIPDTSLGHSASVYLPFFDEGWWSVMITSGSTDGSNNSRFELTAANKIYNGKDGTSIGYISSNTVSTGSWNTIIDPIAYFATSSENLSTPPPFQNPGFSGSLQEIRYYNTVLSQSVFKDYVMNPLSAEGNSVNSAPDQLIFRADLGSELDTNPTSTRARTSIHPKVTGSFRALTSSFASNSNYYLNNSKNYLKAGTTYHTNTETIFLDQPAVGIKNRINDKIRFENNVVPSGNTLSPFRRVTQHTEASASYTPHINYLEVAFSPQNQINDDIISQIGHFNIGDYIGDPRQRFSGSLYPDLNSLSEDYFKKYLKQYDLVDFVRLIKFFDNSLFKMIKDFIPVRTSLASGLVIKQHLLERNKYAQPSVHREDLTLTASIDIGNIEGGPAGMFNEFNGLSTSPVGTKGLGPDNKFGITQSFEETTSGLHGFSTLTSDRQEEFYNGEFSGSTLIISTGELNEECDEFKTVSTLSPSYKIRSYNSDEYEFAFFMTNDNRPLNGFIQTYWNDNFLNPIAPPNPTF